MIRSHLHRLATALVVLAGLATSGPASADTWEVPANNTGIQHFRCSATQQLLVDFEYDPTTGRPTWQGAFAGNSTTHFDGTTFIARGGQPWQGAYRAPLVTSNVQAISIRWNTYLDGSMAEGDHAVKRFDGEATQQLVRTTIQTGRPVPNPAMGYHANGWYWSPSESGTAYGFDVQGDTAFITVFTYTADGLDDWYISTGAMLSATRYEGRAQHWSKASGVPVATDVGALTLAFFYQNNDARYPRISATLPNGTAVVLEPYTC